MDCKIKASTIVGPYRDYDEIRTFEIVACDDNGYYLYVPHYYFLKETKVADQWFIKSLEIDKRFLNENVVYIQENMITNIQIKLSGLSCKICKEFYQYAEGNQVDGSLICYSCKRNPY